MAQVAFRGLAVAFLAGLSSAGPASLPRPSDQPPLPYPYDQADFWTTVKSSDPNYDLAQDLRDGALLRIGTLTSYLQYLVDRNYAVGDPKILADDMSFYVYSVYGDAYFAGCKDVKPSPVKGEMLFIPTYTSGHFVMTTTDLNRRTITVMDSLNGGATSAGKQQLMGKLRTFVVKQLQCHGNSTNEADWSVKNQVNVPQQSNGVDCGVFSLAFADYSARRLPMAFSQQHIPYFRRKIFMELAQHTAPGGRSTWGIYSFPDWVYAD